MDQDRHGGSFLPKCCRYPGPTSGKRRRDPPAYWGTRRRDEAGPHGRCCEAGSIVVHDTPCLSAGEISGVVSNGEIQFGAVKAQSQIVFTGSLGEGDTMGGSYQASANCADATGSWEAEKTGE
jgi:hypothetical protein